MPCSSQKFVMQLVWVEYARHIDWYDENKCNQVIKALFTLHKSKFNRQEDYLAQCVIAMWCSYVYLATANYFIKI